MVTSPMSVTERFAWSQASAAGLPLPLSARVTSASQLPRLWHDFLARCRCGCRCAVVQVCRHRPVGEVMHQDDSVHGVEEHVPGEGPLLLLQGHHRPPGVALAVAAPHVPQLHGEGPLLLRALHVLVQLHLHHGASRAEPVRVTSTEHPMVQAGLGSALSCASSQVRLVLPTPLSPTTTTRTRSTSPILATTD